VRDILLHHGAEGVHPTNAGNEQVTVATVALLSRRYRRAEAQRKRAQLWGPFSACCA
jgi:hypothetical protein